MGLSNEEVADIYRRHADVVYRRCLHMLGRREDALDAVQEIFIKVLTGRERFRGECDPTTWIYRITTNHAINQLRARRPRIDLDSIPLSLHPQTEGLERRIVSRALLEELLEGQDDRNRSILFLHFVDGLEQGEVAAVLGISRRAVVKRLTKLQDQMKKMFSGNLPARQERQHE